MVWNQYTVYTQYTHMHQCLEELSSFLHVFIFLQLILLSPSVRSVRALPEGSWEAFPQFLTLKKYHYHFNSLWHYINVCCITLNFKFDCIHCLNTRRSTMTLGTLQIQSNQRGFAKRHLTEQLWSQKAYRVRLKSRNTMNTSSYGATFSILTMCHLSSSVPSFISMLWI